MEKFECGDYVYYHNKIGDTIPARIRKINRKTERAEIGGNFQEGKNIRWVKIKNLEKQGE